MIIDPNWTAGEREYRAVCDICEMWFANSEDKEALIEHVEEQAEACGWLYVDSKIICNSCQMIEGRKDGKT